MSGCIRKKREKPFRSRGIVSILITVLILFTVLGALLIYSFILIRNLRAASRFASSLQAYESANSGLECALRKVNKGDALLGDTESKINECENKVRAEGIPVDLVQGIDVIPVGAGIVGMADDRLAVQAVMAEARYGGMSRILKSHIDFDCQMVLPALFWGNGFDGEEIDIPGRAPDGAVIGFFDANKNSYFNEGETLIKTPLQAGNPGRLYSSDPIIFLKDAVIEIEGTAGQYYEIVSDSKIVMPGALVMPFGRGWSSWDPSLLLEAPDIDLRGGTIISRHKLRLNPNHPSGNVIGDKETILITVDERDQTHIEIAQDHSTDFDENYAWGGVQVEGSCFRSGNDIEIWVERDVVMENTNMFAANRADDDGGGDLEIHTVKGPGNIHIYGTGGKRIKMANAEQFEFETDRNITIEHVDFEPTEEISIAWNIACNVVDSNSTKDVRCNGPGSCSGFCDD